jgi:hypothetical protein
MMDKFLSEQKAVTFTIDEDPLSGARSAEDASIARLDACVTFTLIDDLVLVHPLTRRDFEDSKHYSKSGFNNNPMKPFFLCLAFQTSLSSLTI